MTLSDLLTPVGPYRQVTGGDPEVTLVTADSRRVIPGAVFFAVPGTRLDGHLYAAEAVRRGASAVVARRKITLPGSPALVLARDVRRALALAASRFRGDPSQRIVLVGVTGTNGKTTTAHLVGQLVDATVGRCAVLGTVGHRIGGESRPTDETTPSPVDLADLLAEAAAHGDTHAVMEVSSHALDQHRADGLQFACGVFTNLTGDHLDYHRTMRRYREAKARLFAGLAPSATAVLNANDPASRTFARRTRARVVTYGNERKGDVRARVLGMDRSGTRFILTSPWGEGLVTTRLLGLHNVENCLAAATAVLALGATLDRVVSSLASVRPVPGRLEPVEAGQPFAILVDYAHTHDALGRVLAAVRPLTAGRLILVFGCGGDRDRTKRPRMAAVAERLADLAIVTSDNPRTEHPAAIISEVLAGFQGRPFAVEPDRGQAIGLAVAEARPGDTVLIAGKGHETYQIVGRDRFSFDDRAVARDAILAAASQVGWSNDSFIAAGRRRRRTA